MNLSVGIVGLPNAGKSTLFNALTRQRLAETSPRPFTTISPHEALVQVPDRNLRKLANLIKPKATYSAEIKFIDIAGIVAGVTRGGGFGGEFLGKIREVNVIAHVVRGFSDPYISHVHQTHALGSTEQILEDIEIVSLELQLAGIHKRTVYVLNVDEKNLNADLRRTLAVRVMHRFGGAAIVLSAKIEEDILDLPTKEKREYLKKFGLEETGLETFVKSAYKLLDLVTFYTIAGGEEVCSWSIPRGTTYLEAAKLIHTDFYDNFQGAGAISVDELLKIKSWKRAKEKGKIRQETRDHIVRDGDVVEFKLL